MGVYDALLSWPNNLRDSLGLVGVSSNSAIAFSSNNGR